MSALKFVKLPASPIHDTAQIQVVRDDTEVGIIFDSPTVGTPWFMVTTRYYNNTTPSLSISNLLEIAEFMSNL